MKRVKYNENLVEDINFRSDAIRIGLKEINRDIVNIICEYDKYDFYGRCDINFELPNSTIKNIEVIDKDRFAIISEDIKIYKIIDDANCICTKIFSGYTSKIQFVHIFNKSHESYIKNIILKKYHIYPDKLILIGDLKIMKICDIDTGTCYFKFNGSGTQYTILSDTRIVTISDNQIFIWDINFGSDYQYHHKIDSEISLLFVKSMSNNKFLVSSGSTIWIWDNPAQESSHIVPDDNDLSIIHDIAVVEDDKILYLLSYYAGSRFYGRAFMYDIKTHTKHQFKNISTGSHIIKYGNKYLVYDGSVMIFDSNTLKTKIDKFSQSNIVTILPDGDISGICRNNNVHYLKRTNILTTNSEYISLNNLNSVSKIITCGEYLIFTHHDNNHIRIYR